MGIDIELSQKIVILFNIARAWGDAGPDEDAEDDGGDTEHVRPEPVIVTEGDPGSVRVRGQVERERLMNNMK